MPTLHQSNDKLLMTASNELIILPFKRPNEVPIRVSVPDSISTSETTNNSHHNGIKTKNGNITCAKFSKCYEYFAVCDDKKNVTVWRSANWNEFYKQWSLPTRANAICFTNDSDKILIADKSGDVLSFNLKPPSDTYSCLLGHLSMLLDVAISPCGKYIVTCDRDEKIRVSKYPNAYNIQCYCLGHTDFVTNVQVLPNFSDNILLSASGDGSIRIWKYIEGFEVGRRNISKDVELKCISGVDNGNKISIDGQKDIEDNENIRPAAYAVKQVKCIPKSSSSATVAAIIDRFNGIAMYTLNGDYTLTSLTTITLEAQVWDMQFCSSTNDLITLMNKSNHIQIYYADTKYIESKALFSSESRDFLTGKEDNILSIETLYKKLFDNVEQYTMRKEKRLEQKAGNIDTNGTEKHEHDSEVIKRLKLDQNV